MCTATWFQRADGYELFFNRDERRTRAAAEPPRERLVAGVRVLAPRDPEAGGTWLAVNEHGLSVALLNAWHVRLEAPSGGFRSRGLLVLDLACARDPRDAAARLERAPLARHQGFTLAVLAPGEEPVAYGWDGARLARAAPAPPLVSSSADLEGALLHRRARYAEAGLAGAAQDERRAAHERFHRDGAPGPGPLAVCMRRADAHTVSASHVVVDAGAVRYRYAPGPPDVTAFGPELVLPRAGTEVR